MRKSHYAMSLLDPSPNGHPCHTILKQTICACFPVSELRPEIIHTRFEVQFNNNNNNNMNYIILLLLKICILF